MTPASTKGENRAKEIASMDGAKESFNDQSNQVPWAEYRSTTPPTENITIQDNRNGKGEDTIEVEIEATVLAPTTLRKIAIATSAGNGDGAKKLGTITSKFPSEETKLETIEKIQLDAQHTFYPRKTASKGTLVATTVHDDTSRTKELSSGSSQLKGNDRSTEVNGMNFTQLNTPQRTLGKPTSPRLDCPNTVNQLTKPRKSKRRRGSKTPEMQKASDKGSKRARHNTPLDENSKDESSGKEELRDTTNEETLDTASATENWTSVRETDALTPTSTSKERRTRNSDFSKSTANYEASPSSNKQEGTRSARKRRRLSWEADACLDNKSPVRVLTTGIELTTSQKNVRLDFYYFFIQSILLTLVALRKDD
jgi:hypothetical protein